MTQEHRRAMSKRTLHRRGYKVKHSADVLIEAWRQFYNERRPHSALGYRPPSTVRREWSDTDNVPPRLTA